jgi:hypothetical protein
MRKVVGIFLTAALLCGGFAAAQETTGSIIGTVTSQDGATMPGVTISIQDPETGFERTTVTNTAGEYKFVALSPAKYALQATLDGFQTYRRNIDVALGRTVKNDFVMALGAITDVIEVTGEAPLVDVTSTVSGITVNADQLNSRVPVGREVTQVVLLAPATVQGDTAFDEATPGQNLASMSGSSVAENSYQVNGLNITNFRNGLGSTFVPFEFVEEVQVKSGGYEAEFGRSTGGVVNMVTKSGTNSFHGGVSAYWRPDSLQEMEDNTYNRPNQDEEREDLELNASIGGPIWKDHLFFFAFMRYFDQNNLYLLNTSGERHEVSQPYWGAKLDWNMTANHRLEGTYIDDTVDVDVTTYTFDRDGGSGLGPAGNTGTLARGGENYIGKYTGIFTENFLLSGQYGKNDFNRTNASEGDPFPYAWDARTGTLVKIGDWVNWQRGSAFDSREAYRVDADWYLGNHSLRGGLDFEENNSEDVTEYSGGIYFVYYAASDPTPDYPYEVRVRHYQNSGSFDVKSRALYVQDSWALTPSLTLNLGVRYEEFENLNSAGETFINVTDQYAPRLGAIWDPSGSGRSKLYASYGLYYLPIASNTNVRMAGGELFDQAFYQWDGRMNPDGSPVGFTDCGALNLNTCGNQGSVGDFLPPYNIYADGEIPDVRSVLSSNFDPMSQWELVLGYERMMGANWSMGARFVAREFNEVIEDYTIDQAIFERYGIDTGGTEYRLGNPGKDFEGYFDFDGDGVIDPATEAVSFSADELGYPEAQREYYAVELTAKRRFANNWMFEGSYTWSQSYGNYEGYVKSDNGQDDAGITQDFDFPGLMENAYGWLPNDRRHNVKLFGAYAFDFGLQLGGNFYYTSGRPVNAFGVHPTDHFAQEYGADSFFSFGVATPRGGQGRTDDVYGFDTMIKYDFGLVGLDWNVRLDVFNIFNNQAVTEVNEYSEQESSSPPNYVADPNYKLPTHYQQPRAVRFGVGVNF